MEEKLLKDCVKDIPSEVIDLFNRTSRQIKCFMYELNAKLNEKTEHPFSLYDDNAKVTVGIEEVPFNMDEGGNKNLYTFNISYKYPEELKIDRAILFKFIIRESVFLSRVIEFNIYIIDNIGSGQFISQFSDFSNLYSFNNARYNNTNPYVRATLNYKNFNHISNLLIDDINAIAFSLKIAKAFIEEES